MNLVPYRFLIDDDEKEFLVRILSNRNPSIHEGNLLLVDKEYVKGALLEHLDRECLMLLLQADKSCIVASYHGDAEMTQDLLYTLKYRPYIAYIRYFIFTSVVMAAFLSGTGWLLGKLL